MNFALRVICIAVYVLGLASATRLLPETWSILATIAAVLLAAHVVESIAMFKHVRRYQGPLVVSIFLTVLFGILHWKPLTARL